MIDYQIAGPILRLFRPEFAHRLGLLGLRSPLAPRFPAADDPFERCGLRFRNRVGIAAGFDKNAVALKGIEALGTGFVEIGTILVEPWRGNDRFPRVKRIPRTLGIWNRLGFPSEGLDKIKGRLRAFKAAPRNGLLVACNIGPHPGHVKEANDAAGYLDTARNELTHLVQSLYEDADFFVMNLSSPNTPGLRHLLQSDDLARHLMLPVRQAIQSLDAQSGRANAMPLLIKLPPEDADREAWTTQSLNAVVAPLVEVCDGFVAVNTSARLAIESGEDSGGISGSPLLETALGVVRELRRLVGSDRLIIGSGGITEPKHAVQFLDAGSDLVEIYSGLVYRGPRLIEQCATACRRYRMTATATPT
jgi:dihydroorotate dehydrogenase